MDLDNNIHVKEMWGSVNAGEAREINVHQVADVELIWKGGDDQKPLSFWKTRQISVRLKNK